MPCLGLCLELCALDCATEGYMAQALNILGTTRDRMLTCLLLTRLYLE